MTRTKSHHRAKWLGLLAVLGVVGAAALWFRSGVGSTRNYIEHSVEIKRPPEEVFAFATDLRNDPIWTPKMEGAWLTSEGPLGVGTTLEITGRLLGRRYNLPCEIIEYEPNRKMRVRGTLGSFRPEGLRSVEAVPDGTRLTMRGEGTGPFWLPVSLVIFLARRELKASMENLKGLLES